VEEAVAEHLSFYYLNPKRVLHLVRPSGLTGYEAESFAAIPAEGLGRTAVLYQFEKELERWLRHGHVPSLAELIIQGRLEVGATFLHRDQFYCSGLAGRTLDEVRLGRLRSKLAGSLGGGELFSIVASTDLTTVSASSFLSGKKDLVLLGQIADLREKSIEAKPIAVGQLIIDWMSENDRDALEKAGNDLSSWQRRMEVTIEEIDTFSMVQGVLPPPISEHELLKRIPEVRMKEFLAQLIGEPFVSKDWGGEGSDLFTDRLIFRGRRTATALVLKGPARFKPLTLADTGKNGDQLVRAFNEPAELVILQHCHAISKPVREVMSALAVRLGRRKHFCTIDGADTIRLLKAAGCWPPML
jgi:hypothetical protein